MTERVVHNPDHVSLPIGTRYEKGLPMAIESASSLSSPTRRRKPGQIRQQRVEVIVIGGGQAGLAMSFYLAAQGRSHTVLEQGRIAESWRSRRWDSLHVVGPNWTLQVPGFC